MHGSGRECGDRVGRADPAPVIICRPATSGDLRAYFDGVPHGTMRAIVAELDGELVGIIGVVREGGWGKYFADFKESLEPHLRSITIMRAVKESLAFVRGYRGPVIAVAEHVEGTRLLTRLGFTHLQGDLFGWLR